MGSCRIRNRNGKFGSSYEVGCDFKNVTIKNVAIKNVAIKNVDKPQFAAYPPNIRGVLGNRPSISAYFILIVSPQALILRNRP